ncbi:MAG: SRPBCC domain-containing protein [Gammaproteobacteria bacterium]|nr:SRPBCC domain-containing protein [Gammaproteobacteria bacterium]
MRQGKSVKINIRRRFSATVESVFDAWLIPYLAGSWMFGPRLTEQEVVTLENEPRSSGHFLFVVNRDGVEQKITGQYQEIRRPEKMICSWGSGEEEAALSKLTLTLGLEAGKTHMKLTHELDPALAENADKIRREWNIRCQALAQLVEKAGKQGQLFK